MRVLLLTAPYADYTYPYHSLAYLVPELRRRGYETDVLDLNAEWFRACFDRRWIDAARTSLQVELAELEQRNELALEEQRRLLAVAQAIALCESIDPQQAIEVFRSEAFYDYARYTRARQHVRQFERLLGVVHPFFDFYVSFASPPFHKNARQLVDSAAGAERFIAEVAGLLRRRLGERQYVFCGVSVPFEAQLLLGCATQLAVARCFPGARRVMGGTAITDVVKHARGSSALREFARCCDDFLIGECDTAIGQYADYCTGKSDQPPDRLIRLHRPPTALARDFGHVDLRAAHLTPDYSWIDWQLYLAPERQVNYSPARGCFWNKCTFCDYGLNEDRPAAPYRRTRPADAALDLSALARSGIRNFYLAVDALDPAFLRELSAALLEAGLDVSWSTELFLNEKFDVGLVDALERSGLVTASFGLESGSDRVLELMGKGRHRSRRVHEPVFAAFRQSSIGLQPKFFFGFPTETDAERDATVQLLAQHADVFSIVTRGNLFDLSRGSIVAKNPSAFGVRNIRRRAPDDDIGGALDFDLEPPHAQFTRAQLSALNAQIDYPPAFERPWAGGIDTFHSKLYIERYGRNVFQKLATRLARGEFPELWSEARVSSAFDVGAVYDNVLMDAVARVGCVLTDLEAHLGGPGLEQALFELRRPLARRSEAHEYTLRWK